ncbi:sulfite exporter TauE/SafE family protein [Thiohalorhabdus sp.]|uniref:sulfite exporter TauE/SafE family protein n=1 Tax=Thiohalorhabdus sp. TaxID=3094134 RepID=UPI002FC2A4DE
MDSLLPVALVIGLASWRHCLGMCGGIIGALSMGLASEVRARRAALVTYVIAYNSGRIASYSVIGALAGAAGSGVAGLLAPVEGPILLRVMVTGLVIAVGLYLAGWFPSLAVVERLGQPLWQRLEPLGRSLFPVRSPRRALAFGAVWGWLPCGMVYSALLLAVGTGGPAKGAAFMALFGLGTLPAVAGARAFAGLTIRLGRIPTSTNGSGVL